MFFGQKPLAVVASTNHVDTLISASTEINGNISFEGSIKIAGTVQGSVKPKGVDSKNKNSDIVTIESGATVNGDIHGDSVIINSIVNGNIVANSVYLGAKAKITGDYAINYKVLQIEPGALLECRLVNTQHKSAPAADNTKAE